MARGQLFIPADADDYFLPETLLFFYEQWSKLSSLEQIELSGINVLCFDNETDNIVGPPFPMDGMKTNNLELSYKYKITGEKWGCVRSDLLKRRRFPIVKNTHFPESYLWLHFAKSYQVICFNKALRRYYTTNTGIIQTSFSKKNINHAKVLIRFNLWFLKNFGLYVLINSPKVVYKVIIGTLSSLIVVLKNWLHIK